AIIGGLLLTVVLPAVAWVASRVFYGRAVEAARLVSGISEDGYPQLVGVAVTRGVLVVYEGYQGGRRAVYKRFTEGGEPRRAGLLRARRGMVLVAPAVRIEDSRYRDVIVAGVLHNPGLRASVEHCGRRACATAEMASGLDGVKYVLSARGGYADLHLCASAKEDDRGLWRVCMDIASARPGETVRGSIDVAREPLAIIVPRFTFSFLRSLKDVPRVAMGAEAVHEARLLVEGEYRFSRFTRSPAS
ncbi:MAG: hypothetical protein GSR78_05145, partial [Desulfurococcales archaeon]|nr:hypothetical protein [Desulfurococcales archaeon]